jgi:uncharacterized membrane protein YbaN (DUF454 family)
MSAFGSTLLSPTGLAVQSRRRSRNPVSRVLYVVAGLVCVGLGALGTVLPLLPTTPFLLLASAAFVRSDPRLYRWLRTLPYFGKLIRDWERDGAVPTSTRRAALLIVPLVVALSLYSARPGWPVAALITILAAIGWTIVYRLPTLTAVRLDKVDQLKPSGEHADRPDCTDAP